MTFVKFYRSFGMIERLKKDGMNGTFANFNHFYINFEYFEPLKNQK